MIEQHGYVQLAGLVAYVVTCGSCFFLLTTRVQFLICVRVNYPFRLLTNYDYPLFQAIKQLFVSTSQHRIFRDDHADFANNQVCNEENNAEVDDCNNGDSCQFSTRVLREGTATGKKWNDSNHRKTNIEPPIAVGQQKCDRYIHDKIHDLAFHRYVHGHEGSDQRDCKLQVEGVAAKLGELEDQEARKDAHDVEQDVG